MSPYLAEFIGTAFLVLLGDGVVANSVLSKSKGNGAGFVQITFGWAVAVLIPVLMFAPHGGAHINPAVTLGLAAIGGLPWSSVPGYIAAQLVGAIVGACLVYACYRDHLNITEDKDAKLATFCTGPAIRNLPLNFISELVTTFVLVFAILGITQTTRNDAGGVGAFGVAAILLACGMGLGGSTGFAINPARDLGPRIAHAFLPIRDKRDSDWGYSWVPVIGPICGGLIAALLANAIFP